MARRKKLLRLRHLLPLLPLPPRLLNPHRHLLLLPLPRLLMPPHLLPPLPLPLLPPQNRKRSNIAPSVKSRLSPAFFRLKKSNLARHTS